MSLSSSSSCNSDNGAWVDQKQDGGSNGLLRGQKGETWEGGMRSVEVEATSLFGPKES